MKLPIAIIIKAKVIYQLGATSQSNTYIENIQITMVLKQSNTALKNLFTCFIDEI